MENQIVYVLTNPAMPSMVKIGKTTQSDVEYRMSQLYSTGVPLPFKCEYAVEVADCSNVEKALHIAFEPSRVNPKREFFEISPEQAIAILKVIGTNDVTPRIEAELNKNITEVERNSANKKKRPVLNFSEMSIPEDAILVYVEDESIQVKVINDRKISFNDEIMSLTKATRTIKELDYSIQPTPYWVYEGKTLKDIYEETHSREED